MKPRIYIETTIVSYLAARLSRDLIVAAHQQLTEEWWTTRKNDFELFTSPLVYREAAAGDEKQAARRLQILAELSPLAINDAALDLALQLIQQGAIPEKAAEDASHISIAAVHGMDYLLTWNCKHLANAQLERLVAAICREAGYEPPVICTPEELLGV